MLENEAITTGISLFFRCLVENAVIARWPTWFLASADELKEGM